jgi:glyoxylase I family protein
MSVPFKTDRIHHVAYRCRGAKETVDWYARVLGFVYTNAFAEDHVPSTGEYDPYMHVFLDCGGGNVLAFFELPNQPAMSRDLQTPAWVQHLAFEVADVETLLAAKAHVEPKALKYSAPPFTVFSAPSISSIPTATGSNSPAISARRTNMPNSSASRR